MRMRAGQLRGLRQAGVRPALKAPLTEERMRAARPKWEFGKLLYDAGAQVRIECTPIADYEAAGPQALTARAAGRSARRPPVVIASGARWGTAPTGMANSACSGPHPPPEPGAYFQAPRATRLLEGNAINTLTARSAGNGRYHQGARLRHWAARALP